MEKNAAYFTRTRDSRCRQEWMKNACESDLEAFFSFLLLTIGLAILYNHKLR